ncbi:enolase C-terminal domain-like protein [Pseudomonas ogarae]
MAFEHCAKAIVLLDPYDDRFGDLCTLDERANSTAWEALRGTRVKLALDANRSLNTRDALRISRECPDIPFILEQPCNSIEELRQIRPQISHGLYMDENGTSLASAVNAIGSGLVDGFGIKITWLGGLHAMRAFRGVRAAHHLPHTCDDAWGGDIIAAACTHMGSTVDTSRFDGVWLSAPYIEGNYDSVNGIKIEGGHIRLPQGPGLGINPDESLFGAPIASFG